MNRYSFVFCCASALGLAGGVHAQDGTGSLEADLRSAAPSFAMLWDVAFADVRDEGDLEPLLAVYDVFPDYDDSAYFRNDTLRYYVEDGVELPDQARDLVTYSLAPDQYVMNDYRDGVVPADPLIDQNAGCSIALDRYTDDGMRPGPDAPWMVTRVCGTSLSIYSQSEQVVDEISDGKLDEFLALGAVLATQDQPESWDVLYDPVGGEVSPTPTRNLYQMTYRHEGGWLEGLPFGPVLGDEMYLGEVKAEYRSEPLFSDTHGAYFNTIYLKVEIQIPITQDIFDQIASGDYFSIE